ncbi:uncharacterized protein LOC142364009 isoform X2 [Opisthocomus hoazin]|uniref:uncharacterized protein LOC142364009 isoform X2 n=1 Tax=Opisthocomus hoazin TaxID=30419 RepID=UPI003F53C5D9
MGPRQLEIRVEIRILGARRRGKGACMRLSIAQRLLPSSRDWGSPEPLAAEPFWLGVQASLKSSGSRSRGISRRKQIPTAIKKRHFLQRQPAWRGERALCCNRGEGQALTQPSADGEAARSHGELARLLPSSQHPQPPAAGRASGEAAQQRQRLEAQPWESLGTVRLPKAHDHWTVLETRPATKDGQRRRASTLPAQAPPRALLLGTGNCMLQANLAQFPLAQPCKGSTG